MGPARLARIMKRPKLTYHIKIRRELIRGKSFKAHMRKPECLNKDSFYGGPSRVSSPPASHPTMYGKFVMNMHTQAENAQKRY